MRSRTLLVCLLAACGRPSDNTISITHDICAPIAVTSANATLAQLTGIDDAIALWRGRGVSALMAGLGTTTPPITGTPQPIEVMFEAAAQSFHGLYDDEAGVVYVNDAISDPQPLAIVIAHELGHAFGLEHVEDRTSLMNPGNLTTPPTEEDQRALEAMWGTCDDAP